MKSKNEINGDFDTGIGSVGFFCMKLAEYILRDNADYWVEMGKAKAGICAYISECSIYQRTIKKHGAVQLKMNL